MTVRALLGAVAWVCALLATAPAASAYDWQPDDVAVSPDGRNVYAVGGPSHSFSRDSTTGVVRELDGLARSASLIAISPDGRFVYTVLNSPWENRWELDVYSRDTATGELTLQRVRANDQYGPVMDATGIEPSPDGRQLYISQTGRNALVVFNRDAQTGDVALAQAFTRSDVGELGPLAVTADGRQVLATGDEAVLAFARDGATGRLSGPQSYASHGTPHNGFPGLLAISPDGSRVYRGSQVYDVYARDADTGTLSYLSTSDFGDAEICSYCWLDQLLALAPDGKSVFSFDIGSLDRHAARLRQAAAVPGGVSPEHTYPGDFGGLGLAQPTAMSWSPDARFAYVSDPYIPGLSVLAWDESARKLSSVQTERLSESYEGPGGIAPSLTIDGGALYTNDPDVTITFKPPRDTLSFRIANDAAKLDDGWARRTTAGDQYSWRLDTQAGAVRDVRHVYLRYWTRDWRTSPRDLSDDIVLDQRDPKVLSARMRPARKRSLLVVRARDNRSGVHQMQLTSNRRKPGRARRFRRHTKLHAHARRLYVRVIDGARNHSRWRKVRR